MDFDQARYEQYLAAFNAPDHDALHRDFFASNVTMITLGNVLHGQEGIKKFYGYFHQCVREHIDLIDFYPTDGGFWCHVYMKLEAFVDLTKEGLAGIDVYDMPPIPKGASYENEMFIHYAVNAEGKLEYIRCAEYISPRK